MNKKLILLLSLTLMVLVANAQESDEEQGKGFKKENLFTGGNIAFAVGSGRTAFGLSPHFGYSINKWLDAAVTVNFNYISQRDNIVVNDKIRQTTIGPGAFVRIFPVNFLFVQAQYEHNFIKQKYIPAPSSYYPSEKVKVGANSLLLGAGYASGRSAGNNNYYYFSIYFDVLKEKYSPYRDSYGRTEPIIRAGYNIALFQGRNKRY
jgi:hypothetical protein